MMELVTRQRIDAYAKRDRIELLLKSATAEEQRLQCHGWLQKSLPKRYIFDRLYGDLLFERTGLRVLDVGGGLTGLTRHLHQRHDYTVLDIFAHDSAEAISRLQRSLGNSVFRRSDWYEFKPAQRYDVIIANDLLPNVDQRLDAFLTRFIDWGGEIRLSLTFYNQLRFYMANRIDADEVLCVQAWSGPMTSQVIGKYIDRIEGFDNDLFSPSAESVYANGRHVCLAVVRGG